MKILVVNNITDHLNSLTDYLQNHEVTTVEFYNLTTNTGEYDCIILTGSYRFGAKRNADTLYKKECELIQNTTIPVLGICIGFQLICLVHNEHIEQLPEKQEKCLPTTKTSDDPILKGLSQPFTAQERHRWFVKETRHLKTLATSPDGVEAVKHPSKPIYGVQFHPEIQHPDNKSTLVLDNFLTLAGTHVSKR